MNGKIIVFLCAILIGGLFVASYAFGSLTTPAAGYLVLGVGLIISSCIGLSLVYLKRIE